MWPFKRRTPVISERDDPSMQSAKESAAQADRALMAAKEQQQQGTRVRDMIRHIREVNHLSELFSDQGMGRG